MRSLLLVGVGSALGGMMRYGVSLLRFPFPSHFPWWTLAVNVIGSLLIGLFAAWLGPGDERNRLLLMTGLCGGFTTYSAFSIETVGLIETGENGLALISIGANLVGSLGGCAFGYWLAR